MRMVILSLYSVFDFSAYFSPFDMLFWNKILIYVNIQMELVIFFLKLKLAINGHETNNCGPQQR